MQLSQLVTSLPYRVSLIRGVPSGTISLSSVAAVIVGTCCTVMEFQDRLSSRRELVKAACSFRVSFYLRETNLNSELLGKQYRKWFCIYRLYRKFLESGCLQD